MVLRIVKQWFVKTSAAKLIVGGFALVILIGGFLLWLPICHNPGVELSFLDALFESGSAVCVTGLTVVPVGSTFNILGKIIMAILIQIGGMGIVLLGIFIIFLTGGKMGFKTRSLFVQAQNLFGYTRLVTVAKQIILIMFGIEIAGALLCWPIFAKDYDLWTSFGYACFHSISSFNNAGFDILGGFDSLCAYADNIPMNIVTTALVILGGFGFIAMMDIITNRFCWHKFLLTTKVVILMTLILLTGGMILLKLTSDMTWMEAWFQSVIARTAGFATVPLGNLRDPALLVFTFLMFVGASPNSTGGGVKTTTLFAAALKAFSSTAEHDEDSVFYRRIPEIVFTKAFVVIFYALGVIMIGTFLILINQPEVTFMQALVEVTSAVATVGSSCGITTSLTAFSRIVIIFLMFVGRVGPVTIANLLVTKSEKAARYTEESILIG